MPLKFQHSLKTLLFYVVLVAAVFAVVYSNWFLSLSSTVTETPVNWMRDSSAMAADIEYLSNNKKDPNIKNHEAVNNLRAAINGELPTGSSEAEIRKHITRHFRNPSFELTGLFNDCWRQNAHGFQSVLDRSRMVTVRYHIRGGTLFHIGIDLGIHDGYIDVTEPVDWYDFPETTAGPD